jgi:hypothetical protein
MENQLKLFGASLDGKGHKSDIEKLEAAVLAGMDDSKYMREFALIKGQICDIDTALKECANIEHLLGLDRKYQAMREEQTTQADGVRNRMRDLGSKVEMQISSFQNYKSAFDERFSQMESNLADRTQSRELMRDMEDRIRYMQEDQKRARDMLESSILEQIRLEQSTVHSQASQIKEQWDRELKARAAHQENYNDLLGQERSSRAAESQQMEGRMRTFEKSVFNELQRIWTELGKEVTTPTPVIVQQPTYTAKEYVMPPVYTAPSMPEYIMSPRVATVRPGPLHSAASVAVAPSISTSTGMPYGTMSMDPRTMVTRQYSNGMMSPAFPP